MTLKNRYTYTIFIDNGLIYSEWGREILSLSIGGGALQKIAEKHCCIRTNMVGRK